MYWPSGLKCKGEFTYINRIVRLVSKYNSIISIVWELVFIFWILYDFVVPWEMIDKSVPLQVFLTFINVYNYVRLFYYKYTSLFLHFTKRPFHYKANYCLKHNDLCSIKYVVLSYLSLSIRIRNVDWFKRYRACQVCYCTYLKSTIRWFLWKLSGSCTCFKLVSVT